MSTGESKPARSVHHSTSAPVGRARDGRKTARYDNEVYQLKNSLITVETGPVGLILHIERGYYSEYIGPVPVATVDAIREVANAG